MKFEAFSRYQNYLTQNVEWPSESSASLQKISEMVPRYAASAHAKLLRWADTQQARAALNIYDRTERSEFVRRSPLAQALARVAQSLPVVPTSVISDDRVGDELIPASTGWNRVADERDIILAFAPVLAEHTDLDISTIFKVSEALAKKAKDEWTVVALTR